MNSVTTGRTSAKYAALQEELLIGAASGNLIGIDFDQKGSPLIWRAPTVDSGGGVLYAPPVGRGATGFYLWSQHTTMERMPTDSLGFKVPGAREAEINWLARQTNIHRALAGQWIALEGERLLAHGDTLAEVLQEARSRGVEHPLVLCVPEAHEEEVVVIV